MKFKCEEHGSIDQVEPCCAKAVPEIPSRVVVNVRSTGVPFELRIPSPDRREAGACYCCDREDAFWTARDMYRRAGYEDIVVKINGREVNYEN